MSDMGVAIAVHMLAVIWWIGGLAFVTLVFLPALRHELDEDPHALLETIEQRFAPQARTALLLVGASGGYLLWRLGAWRWLALAQFWWLDAMIGYWVIFAALLFVIEPAGILDRALRQARSPSGAWRGMHALHLALLTLAVVIIAAATAGSHGW